MIQIINLVMHFFTMSFLFYLAISVHFLLKKKEVSKFPKARKKKVEKPIYGKVIVSNDVFENLENVKLDLFTDLNK